MLRKISGLYLILIAVTVAVYTVAEPLSYAAGDSRVVWSYLDPLMMVAALLGVICSWESSLPGTGSSFSMPRSPRSEMIRSPWCGSSSTAHCLCLRAQWGCFC